MTARMMLGAVHTMARTIYRAVDIAKFMIYTKPLVKPSYIWNGYDKMTTHTPKLQMQ
jgi:hypothetical protein